MPCRMRAAGPAPLLPAACFPVGAVRGLEGCSGASMLTDCACIAVCVCGWDAADNGIGEAGAVALAKALESGQCTLNSLDLRSESTCLAACAAGLWAFHSVQTHLWRLRKYGLVDLAGEPHPSLDMLRRPGPESRAVSCAAEGEKTPRKAGGTVVCKNFLATPPTI